MQIADKVFIRWKFTSAARLTLMGLCSLTIYLIQPLSTLPFGVALVAAIIATSLFIAAILILFINFSGDRTAQLSPHLIIPSPLFWHGLNTENEPFTYWELIGKTQDQLLFTTSRRTGVIPQRWFSPDEWRQLVDSLPPLLPLPKELGRNQLAKPVLVFAGICLMIHYTLPQLTNITPFNYLLSGAYNWPLVADGKFYRVLSTAWVHGSNNHLYINFVSLIFLAGALRNSFSTKSISALLISTSIVSVTLGSLATSATVVLGASGAIMGLFGFLFAAQRKNDLRLHPINRIARQNFLYFLLAIELAMSLTFSWYGGTVHLAGFATGFAYYHGFEANKISYNWPRAAQNLILFVGMGLSLFWLVETYKAYKHPAAFIADIQKLGHPTLTALSSAALPDLRSATRDDVIAAKRNAQTHLATEEMNSMAIARSEHWLGSTDAALVSLRELTAAHPKHDLLHPLWLAVERDAAKQRDDLAPITVLPAGNETTYLISTDYQYVARLHLRTQPTPFSEISTRLARQSWLLAGATDQNAPGSYGMWRMTDKHYPTQRSGSLAQ